MPAWSIQSTDGVIIRFRAFVFVIVMRIIILLSPITVLACTAPSADLSLMPTPAVFENGNFDPFRSTPPEMKQTAVKLFYATDRKPLSARAATSGYGRAQDSDAVLGTVGVSIGEGEFSWDDLRAVSLLKKRTSDPLLKRLSISEFGPLRSVPDTPTGSATARMPNMRFSAAINYRLERSRTQDVFVFVSDPRVDFDRNILHAAQLWFYMGFEGAMVVYSRSGSPDGASFSALLAGHTAASRHLRHLLQLLATESGARAVHIVGYNQGVVTAYQALKDLKLQTIHAASDQPLQRLNLGQAIFVGPDVDLRLFNVFNQDRLFEAVQRISLYVTPNRGVAGNAQPDRDPVNRQVVAWLETGQVSLIETPPDELTGAGDDTFFGQNQWLSSDVLMLLKFGLGPGERGLVRNSFTSAWYFPIDYVERLRRIVFEPAKN